MKAARIAGFALAAFLGGVALTAFLGHVLPVGAFLAVEAVLVALAVVFERAVYKPLARRRPGSAFRPTSERFRDPTSGRMVSVYEGPGGERVYVDEDQAAAAGGSPPS